MKLGQVIGNLSLSHQEPALKGGRWLVVAPLTKAQYAGAPMRPISPDWNLIVYDNLGAQRDDIIAYVEGAEATMPFDHPMPIDAYNVCLIDKISYHPPSQN